MNRVDTASTLSSTTNFIHINDIRALVQAEMTAVNATINAYLTSPVELIKEIGNHIIHSGGKRLRPLLVLLSAKTFGYEGTAHIELATTIEFLHTATLLHDDVVDASELRRGRQTANTLWGNEASVLVGDYLYARALQSMTKLENTKVMRIIAEATSVIVEGEVQQLINRNNPETTESNYMMVIRSKTAKLFEAATQLGAVISHRSAAEEQAMAQYGLHLGNAYQLIDDLLDYIAPAEQMGKNPGDDLAEGKPTLPLIYALEQGTAAQKKLIQQTICRGGLDNLAEILEIIHSTGGIEYTKQKAAQETAHAQAALQALPASSYRDALSALAQLILERTG
jgi:octaprenyl-diphosphate synthase